MQCPSLISPSPGVIRNGKPLPRPRSRAPPAPPACGAFYCPRAGNKLEVCGAACAALLDSSRRKPGPRATPPIPAAVAAPPYQGGSSPVGLRCCPPVSASAVTSLGSDAGQGFGTAVAIGRAGLCGSAGPGARNLRPLRYHLPGIPAFEQANAASSPAAGSVDGGGGRAARAQRHPHPALRATPAFAGAGSAPARGRRGDLFRLAGEAHGRPDRGEGNGPPARGKGRATALNVDAA